MQHFPSDKAVLLSVREVSETMAFQANVEPLKADNGHIRTLNTESSKSVVTARKHKVSCLANHGLVHPDSENLVCPSGRTNESSKTFDCPRTHLLLQSSISSATFPGVESSLPVTAT